MNQLGKNSFLALCVVVMLLVILGLRYKFGGDGQATLLSQPSENTRTKVSGPAKGSPRPRVLQAKSIPQHEAAILSPTSSPYVDAEAEPELASGAAIAPIPSPSLVTPELVSADEPVPSPVTASVGDELPEATPFTETPTTPVAAPLLPKSVLTDSEDSFWSISERVYGSGKYYRALFRHNEAKVLRPDQLRAGVEVETPPLDVLQELYPADFPHDPSPTP